MKHAFECLTPCRHCSEKGCIRCMGTGICGHEWRGDNPPKAPCQRPECCCCSRDWCNEQSCSACAERPWKVKCYRGACPRCGGLNVEWHSFGVEPEDVYLTVEVDLKTRDYYRAMGWRAPSARSMP